MELIQSPGSVRNPGTNIITGPGKRCCLQELVDIMERIGLKPTLRTWEVLLDMYATGRDPKSVETIFAKMTPAMKKVPSCALTPARRLSMLFTMNFTISERQTATQNSSIVIKSRHRNQEGTSTECHQCSNLLLLEFKLAL